MISLLDSPELLPARIKVKDCKWLDLTEFKVPGLNHGRTIPWPGMAWL